MPDSKSLFRTEALQSEGLLIEGQAARYQPVSSGLYLLLFSVLLATLLLFSVFNNFKTTINVRGMLLPESGLVQVYPQTAGIYGKSSYQEGDRVSGNDIVSHVLSPASQQHSASGLLKHSHLEARRSQLEKLITLTSESGQLRQTSLVKSEKFLHSEVKNTMTTILSVQQRLALLQQKLNAQQALKATGHISTDEYNQSLQQHLALQEHENSLIRNHQEQQHLLSENRSRQKLEQLELQQSLLQLQSELDAVMLQLAELEHTESVPIIAPVSGTISDFRLVAGGRATPEFPAFTLIPDNQPLTVHLYLPASEIASVALHQTVLIQVDAFDYRDYGLFPARLTFIGESSIDPRSQTLPLQVNQAVYLIKAQLDKTRHDFHPGMLLSAEIVTADRPLIAYVLEPLIKALEK